MIENRMVLDRAWPKERGEEYFAQRENEADRINDDLWLAEVAKQISEATDILKKANDEAEHD